MNPDGRGFSFPPMPSESERITVDEKLAAHEDPRRLRAAGRSPGGIHRGSPRRGSHLARYGRRFPAVEINSSFYRPHRPSTYARWASETPEDFAFALKVPKAITHQRRLVDADEPIDRFLAESDPLGPKRGPVLVQLPPSLPFDASTAAGFFDAFRLRYEGGLACEPRHASWFTAEAERLLASRRVARVAADPAVVPEAAEPGGWDGLVYYRLHGSPKIYYSPYPAEALDALASKLAGAAVAAPVWCIFDNTALGAATEDALTVLDRLGEKDNAGGRSGRSGRGR